MVGDISMITDLFKDQKTKPEKEYRPRTKLGKQIVKQRKQNLADFHRSFALGELKDNQFIADLATKPYPK